MSRDPGFLNVDLELGAPSRARLEPLVSALDGVLFELFRGRIGGLYRAHYETNACGLGASATIHDLATTIERLKGPARRAWSDATRRDFNVGVELARGVRCVELTLDADAIQRVAALGGRIAFTAYQVSAMSRPRRTRTGPKPRATRSTNRP